MKRLRRLLNRPVAITKGTILLLLAVSFVAAAATYYHQQLLPHTPQQTAGPFIIKTFTPQGVTTFTDKLTIYFSHPVDVEKLRHHITINPPIRFDLDYLNSVTTTSVVLTPLDPIEVYKRYTVNISADLTSLSGDIIAKAYGFEFIKHAEKPITTILSNGVQVKIASLTTDNPTVTITKDVNVTDLTAYIYKTSLEQVTDYFIYTKDYISEPVQLSTEPAGTETAQIPIKTTSQDISLPVSPGMYEIVLRQKNNQILQRALAIVSNANIIVRQDGDQVLFSSFTPEGLIDRTPLTLTAYSSRQRLTSLKTFTVTGTSTSDFPLSSPIDFFFGDIDGHTVFIPMQLPQSTADINARTPDQTPYRIFLTTDRPLYKPGDTVFYRGIARRDTDGLYAPLDSNTIIDVTFMYAVDGKQETLRQQVTTDAQGIFHNFFTIPTTILQGLREEYPQTYNLTASIKQAPRDPYDFDGTAFFQVQNFTKPTVLLTTTATDESIMWNKSVSYTISATTVDGKPLPNKKLYYQLYHDNLYETTKKAFSKSFNITAGGMCGGGFSLWNDYWGTELGSTRSTITTNEQGQATITFTPKESSIIPEYSKRITLLASVFDDQLTEIYSAKTVTAYRSTYVLNFAPSSQVQRPGTPLSIPFLVETLEGQPIQPPITATLKKSENSKDNTPLSVSYSQPGVGLATLASTNDLQPGSYYVELATTDDAGRAITSSRYIQIYESESENQRNNGVNYVTVTSPNTTYLVGETISLTFQSPTHIQALLTAERGEMYFTKEIDLPQGESTIDIPVDSSFTPSVTIVLSYMVNGKYYTHGIPINIPAMHKLLNVSVTTDKTTYTPGDTAQTTIHVTDAKGNPVQTAVSLAVVDQAIFALRKSAAQPIHSSFYFFRPRTTNASSSRNQLWDYGGRGGGGGGSNGPGSLVDTLYWNPTLTTGADGTAHVAIPLGTAKTTWNFQVYASDVLTNVGQESELIQVQ